MSKKQAIGKLKVIVDVPKLTKQSVWFISDLSWNDISKYFLKNNQIKLRKVSKLEKEESKGLCRMPNVTSFEVDLL